MHFNPKSLLIAALLASSLPAYQQSSPQQPAAPVQSTESPQPAQPNLPVQPAPIAPAVSAAPAKEEGAQSGPSQEYQGPSIISRDKSLIGEHGGKLLDFRIWAGVSGIYDSGLTPLSTDQNGKLIDLGGGEGIEASIGVSGARHWQRDSLTLDYSGSFRHYTSVSGLDGSDQFLALRYERVLTRRLMLDFKESAGTSTLANGAFSYLPLTSVDLYAVPTNDLFDNRVYYSMSRVGLIYRKSARLSFSINGQGYLVRRQSAALAGLNGYIGGGDVAYRITRRQTVSASYSYTHFDFQKIFGFANIQTVALGYAIGLGRRWDASFTLGGSYAESRGLQQIAVDPAIVAIIGVPTIVANFDRFVAVPYGQVSIVRRFSRSAVSLNASTGVSPGNGVYLTSRANSAMTSYSYEGIRRWSLSSSFGFSQYSTIGQTLGKYDNYQAGLGATYKFATSMHLTFRYDYRHYSTSDNFYDKDSHRLTLGLAWSPGELPLAIW